MITLKPTTTNFLLYKNLVKRFSEDCEIILRNDIDGSEYPLPFTATEGTRSYTIHFTPLMLEGGHYKVLVRDGDEVVYSEKVYVADVQ